MILLFIATIIPYESMGSESGVPVTPIANYFIARNSSGFVEGFNNKVKVSFPYRRVNTKQHSAVDPNSLHQQTV